MNAGGSELSEFYVSDGQSVSERLAQQRREVANDIVSASYLRGDCSLPPGRRTGFDFGKYLFETRPTILRRLAEMLSARVPTGIDRLGATEVGGVPLVVALSLATGLPFVVIRAADTDPVATAGSVMGELHVGERVLLVQDIIDDGLQTMESAVGVEQLGGRVVGVLAVIERESQSASKIRDAGYEYEVLFCLRELDG